MFEGEKGKGGRGKEEGGKGKEGRRRAFHIGSILF